MISIKSEHEIELMREAGKRLAQVHNEVAAYLKPGLSTYEIDMYAVKVIKKLGGTPAFYHLYDFPGNFCISLNDEVIHGIPSKEVIIKEGDVLKIDGGVTYKGYQSDAARTYIIGKGSEEQELFVDRTRQAFFEGIRNAIPGNHICDIGRGIEAYISKFGYGIIEDYVGHGIGKDVHEEPDIPDYETINKGPLIREHMTFAVEPMITYADNSVYVEDNGWTVRTVDGSMAAHYENTILVTANGPEILTL